MNLAPFAILEPWYGVARVVVALACAGLAFAVHGSPGGGIAWLLALGIACHGYGVAFERLVRDRQSMAMTVVSGLAVVLIVGTLLGGAGVASKPVLFALVALGCMLDLLPRLTAEHELPRASVVALVAVALAGMLLAVVPLVLRDVSIRDGFDHVLSVARLWSTGKTFPVYHQAGSQLVGEALASLTTGAAAAIVFQQGACAALVVFVLATELGAGRDRLRTVLSVALTIPIVLDPGSTTEWSGLLFHVATIVALGDALERRRTGWHAVLLAVALAVDRHEHAIIALPYIAAAIVLPRGTPSRRALIGAVVGWLVLLVGYQVALAVEPTRATVNAIVLLLAIPFALAVAGVSGASRRTLYVVITFAVITWGLAIGLDAIRPAQRGAATAITIGFGALAGVCLRARAGDRLSPAALGVVLAAALAFVVLPAMVDYDRRGFVATRLYRALLVAQQRAAIGEEPAESALRALQDQVPAGARLGFWGRSPAQLDYRRHRLRDVSWSTKVRRDRYFLTPLLQTSLKGLDYLLVENTAAQDTQDPWDTLRPATAYVADQLELVVSNEYAQLFRVRR